MNKIINRDEAIIIISLLNFLYTKSRVKAYKFSINNENLKVLMFHLKAKSLRDYINSKFKTTYTVRDITHCLKRFIYTGKKITTSILGVSNQGYHITEEQLNYFLSVKYIEQIGEDKLLELEVYKNHDIRN